MQTDRIASLAGEDMKTHQEEKRNKRKRTHERFKASEEQRTERCDQFALTQEMLNHPHC